MLEMAIDISKGECHKQKLNFPQQIDSMKVKRQTG